MVIWIDIHRLFWYFNQMQLLVYTELGCIEYCSVYIISADHQVTSAYFRFHFNKMNLLEKVWEAVLGRSPVKQRYANFYLFFLILCIRLQSSLIFKVSSGFRGKSLVKNNENTFHSVESFRSDKHWTVQTSLSTLLFLVSFKTEVYLQQSSSSVLDTWHVILTV